MDAEFKRALRALRSAALAGQLDEELARETARDLLRAIGDPVLGDIWLRTECTGSQYVEVEVDGEWRVAIKEFDSGITSHCVATDGKKPYKWPKAVHLLPGKLSRSGEHA